jgi:hypothetical protein
LPTIGGFRTVRPLTRAMGDNGVTRSGGTGRPAQGQNVGMATALEEAEFVQCEEPLGARDAVTCDLDGVVRLVQGYGVVTAGIGIFGLVAPPAQPIEGS